MTVLFPTNSSRTANTTTTDTTNNEVFSPVSLSDAVPTTQGYIKPKESVSVVVLAPSDIEDESEGRGSWHHASVHIVTASIGTGILGLSKAFGQLNLITSAPGLGRRLKTFLEVGAYAWGNKIVNYILTPLQLFNCVGTGIAYLIVAGQNIQKSFQGMSLVGAIMSMVYALIAIVLCFVLYGSPDISPEPTYEISTGVDAMWNMFLGISTVAFLFGMQAIQPDIQNTLRRENPTSEIGYMRGLAGAYSVTIPLYVLIGVAGYLTFGAAVSSDILVSISDVATGSVVKAFITIAQVTVVVHVIVAYQVWSMPVYALFEQWRAKYINRNKENLPQRSIEKPVTGEKLSSSSNQVESSLTVEPADVVKSKFSLNLSLSPTIIAIRFAYVGFCGFVAMAIPFFGDIMALNGSVAIVPLCFICPIILRFTGEDRASINTPEKVWALFILIVMCTIAVVGGISAVRQIVLDAGTYQLFM
ncbi:hypothetical protein SARC_08001 [Sphaeroforma arctica JP610]|uniref:Amino acid transporter transmembrane domain-containing protein n=1 Tax=Sphaeroforma arctica JP610 TaxID=667725 RepID=A0A0L0FUM5_9EUKA|nr:hypothetical protein SARC_08001 [Sphaeroforma arctica JP610]KNC79613.1 hypothetical protein SARC_08001 [Sphaeroforma arctica JP610]|eukprot:XP_014153515.1 hypothetical protein SARC_08001 [Sphaeroforma arctica JP610]